MKKLLLLSIIASCLSLGSFAQWDDINRDDYRKSKRTIDVKDTVFVVKYDDYERGVIDIKIPVKDGKILFTRTYNSDNASSSKIFGWAKIAIADVFKSATDVTQLDDSENKVIIVKGWTNWVKDPDAIITTGFQVWFTLKIECRDNRYKISMYDFRSKTGGGSHFVFDQNDCLENGIKKNNIVKSNIYGLSWVAWWQEASNTMATISNAIADAAIKSDDNW